jgi:hypothetical protein
VAGLAAVDSAGEHGGASSYQASDRAAAFREQQTTSTATAVSSSRAGE